MPQFSDDLFLGQAQTFMGISNQPATSVFTATCSTTTLTVSALLSGDPLIVGQYVTGSSITANSYITAFGTGTGGAGTYTLSQSSTQASATTMYASGNALLGDPAPMDLGIGPLGRTFVWDVIPETLNASNVSVSANYQTLGSKAATLADGTNTKSITRADGTTVIQLDCPRALSTTTAAFTAATFVTANITASNTTGSFAVATTPLVGLAIGQTVTVTGTQSGTNTTFLAGTYLISATNGTTTFTLTTTAGAAITTVTSGTNTGLTFANTITAVNSTVSGYDIYGQAMSEVIASSTSASTAVNGKKAFYQISGITVAAPNGNSIAFGTTDILGSPVRILDLAYIVHAGYNNTLADNAGNATAAATATATTTTGDVRGTFAPSGSADGTKRLVMTIALPAIAVGPNATRVGALGVTQA
jgi:hypothetical protein